ncbi:MAG: PEP-CTERM sorting domain-containing protein [Planctomycetes bacterium]|nr:PEP-CTERM sorting domain-containing protein [Planctomycetota bacterium]
MMLRPFRIALFAVVFGSIIGLPSSIEAGLLPINVNTTKEGDNYRYSYGVVLTSDSILRNGDYFTIYDFDGMVANSNSQPAGFTFSSENTGPTPTGILPVDSPSISNATWTYTGPDTLVGQSGIGNFVVESQYGSTVDGLFTAQTHRQVDGKTDANITETEVPVPTGVPEPASLALIGIGVPIATLFRYLRRRS